MIRSCQQGQKQMLWAHIMAVKFFYKPGSFVFKWEGFIMLWSLKFYCLRLPFNVKSYWTWCFWQFQIKISKWMKQHNCFPGFQVECFLASSLMGNICRSKWQIINVHSIAGFVPGLLYLETINCRVLFCLFKKYKYLICYIF